MRLAIFLLASLVVPAAAAHGDLAVNELETLAIRDFEGQEDSFAWEGFEIWDVYVGEGYNDSYDSEWYVKYVRPEVSDQTGPRDFVFVRYDGRPFTIEAARALVSGGLHRVLDVSVSGHSLRRWCATWRYHHGWDLQDIADLLDDDPKVVEGSYLDRSWLKTAGRKARSGTRYPEVAWVRPVGKEI